MFTEIKSKPRQKDALGFLHVQGRKKQAEWRAVRRTERWGKQAELSKRGTQALHEVIPQGLIENQRPRVSDEAPGARRKTFPPLSLPLAE